MKRLASVVLLAFLTTHHSPLTTHSFTAQAGDDNPAAKSQSGPRKYKGRVIAPVMTAQGGGADWLERQDRDATEQPDKVIEALKISPGSTVADVGAGTGYFSLRIAKKIGPEGKVLATDVQPEMLRLLAENMKKAGVKNIDRILATANDAKLPANKVDLALMVDVYHELQDPERTMAQVRKSLKSDGRLVLVEYRAEDPTVEIKPEHKTTLRQIRYEIEPMGFRLQDVLEFLPHQHVEIFVRDDVQGEDVIRDASKFPTIRKPGWAGLSGANSNEPYEADGFTAAFNGKDLTGWSGDQAVWHVRDATINGSEKVSPKANSELKSTESYEDFELDLQWRLKDTDGSAGVWIRSNPRLFIRLDSGAPYLAGYPEALAARRSGEATTNAGGSPIHPTSALANALVLPAEWNRLTVRCSGRRAMIAVNGIQTADFEAGQDKTTAPIALQPSKGEVEFREIWIKRLNKQD